jgi:NAD(P)H dehydrogenase (quinone)
LQIADAPHPSPLPTEERDGVRGTLITGDLNLRLGVNMQTVLILYHSRSGNTEEMARAVEQGVKSEGVKVVRKKVGRATLQDLLKADGIILGSPTYYGTMAAELKAFIDKSVKYHGKLEGKVGGAFSSGGGLGGGVETTVLDITKALLIHGMVIQGDPWGSHYGTVSIGKPNAAAKKECKKLGEKVARLVKRLALAS